MSRNLEVVAAGCVMLGYVELCWAVLCWTATWRILNHPTSWIILSGLSLCAGTVTLVQRMVPCRAVLLVQMWGGEPHTVCRQTGHRPRHVCVCTRFMDLTLSTYICWFFLPFFRSLRILHLHLVSPSHSWSFRISFPYILNNVKSSFIILGAFIFRSCYTQLFVYFTAPYHFTFSFIWP
jgi:hypothetical protein